MPTLLEKPTPSATPLQPSELLHHRHRWERWRAVIFILLIGLTVTFVSVLLVRHAWHASGDWKIVAGVWVGGFLVTALGALFGWRSAPSSLLDTAQHLDQHLVAKNRLEAAATLHGSTSPLAHAQREETAAYLSRAAPGVHPVRLLPWLVGGILVLVAANLITLTVWVVPVLMRPPAPAPPPPPKPIPTASIVWQSPEPESKANPIEEVPTVAIAESSSGLKDLSLEISVNGAPKKSVPLPATPFDQAGKHTLKSSLYMDELGVEPFDVVSYYIGAHRITDQAVPETTSPIQFIQVRPFRDDVTQVHGADGGNPNYALLIRLKLAELKSIKENFILAHTDLAVTDPMRVKENDLVGKNQGDLAGKTEEVVQAFIQAGLPADMIDLLQQAEPPMKDASQKILATHNNDALPPQEKALALIVEVEKFFIKIMADKGSGPPDNNPEDPFKDKQQHELKKRMEAAAGQLELLAKNQTKLAGDLGHSNSADAENTPTPGTPAPAFKENDAPNNPPSANGTNPGDGPKIIPLPAAQAVDPFGKDADKGTFAQRQARVLQGIETLLNTNNVLPAAVNDDLQAAQKDASTSAHQLDQTNVADAREPAAAAAQDLQKAVAEMNRIGEQDTKVTMEETQQKLNDQAAQLEDMAQHASPDNQKRLAELAQQIHDAQKALENAADKQQESGSEAGAQRLDHLAKAMNDQQVDKDLAAMSKTALDAARAQTDADQLKALAAEAAQNAAAGKPSAQDLAKLVDALQASRANLVRLAQQAAGTAPKPDGQSGTAPGEKPGTEGTAKSEEGKAPGQGEQPAKGDQGQGAGQNQGLQGDGKDQGQQGKGNGQGQGSGQGQDQEQGQGEGQAQGQGGTGAGPGAGGGVGPPTMQAYRDVLADIQDQIEQVRAAVPSANITAVMQSVEHARQDVRARPNNMSNATAGYEIIAKPLDQLIVDLQQAMAHAQRDEVIKQPDLDEAPAAYRSAVSDYFETMSKDYHPDSADADTKKP